jgi:hypothetical protein
MKQHNQQENTEVGRTGEQTLRVIANLPAPEGLADRVQTRLRTAPRSARVFYWPLASAPGGWGYGQAFRGAAAAAIVCVVVGGGWRIYSHVQPAASARVIVMPTTPSPARGFSTAGSVHTPDPRPVLTHQAEPEPLQTGARRPGLKSGADQAKKPHKGPRPSSATPAGSPQ